MGINREGKIYSLVALKITINSMSNCVNQTLGLKSS